MTETILNPERATGDYATAIKPRVTEMVPIRDIKPGDTVINDNAAGVPAYRVVSESVRDDLNEGFWIISFDPARDVPGPGLDSHPGSGSRGSTQPEASEVERVTDLGDWEMADIMRLRSLDKLSDGRGVWEIAGHVSKDGQVLVRFAGSDNFEKMPLGTIVLVEGRRMNKHVQHEYRRAMKARHY